MRLLIATVLAVLSPFAIPAARAACIGTSQLAAARTAVAAACDCATATSASSYKRCARRVLADMVNGGLLSNACRTAAQHCASVSTCGRPGAVACCATHNGATHCNIRRDAASCMRAGGVAKACPSCCEACTDGCVATSTSTSTTITTTTTTVGVTTTTAPVPPCAPSDCTPACADGLVCQAVHVTGDTDYTYCTCAGPGGPCSPAVCPGWCANGNACVAVQISGNVSCGCAD